MVKHLLKLAPLYGHLDIVGKPNRGCSCDELQKNDAKGIDVRFDTEHASLLVLRVNVAESASCSGHVVLGGRVRGSSVRNEAGKANIGDLADKVVIKKYVSWFEITVDNGFRLRLVEEMEASGNLGGYLEAQAPWEWSGVREAE